VTLGTNSVSPAPAVATRCFNGATETCELTFTAASCDFDAVEPGGSPQDPIFTKLAGVPFDIDVLALLDAATINPGYTGPVTVDLVDSSSVNCPSGGGLNSPIGITFVAADSGRKTISFNYPNAAKNVRVRATVGASAPACSADNFAIRPQVFTLNSTDATNTATTGTPRIKAGASFTLSATAVAGYDGTPILDNSKLTGTPNAGTISGSFPAASVANGISTSVNFSYNEVGHFGLEQHAVTDDLFTVVDQPDECNAGYSNSLSAGRYGCSIGSLAVPQVVGSSGFGRFIPDRFAVSSNVPLFASACSSGFTYLGQPFSYLIDPELTLTALNSMGTPTLNYGGAYWKHNSDLGNRNYSNNATTAASLSVSSAGTAVWGGTADSDGFGTVSISNEELVYSKPSTVEMPFATDVDLSFSANDLIDSDGVCYDPDANSLCDGYAINNIGSTEQRYGQMILQSAYGSETLDLSVPFSIEYYNGSQFVPHNDDDSCSSFDVTHLNLTVLQGPLAPGDTTPVYCLRK